jgi:hypothetical protein
MDTLGVNLKNCIWRAAASPVFNCLLDYTSRKLYDSTYVSLTFNNASSQCFYLILTSTKEK